MNNPSPITRARRIERRRKALGSDDPCFYCDEPDIVCLEIEHPLGQAHDKKFTRIVCSNCHKKLEARRDMAKLTKNGKRRVSETKQESDSNYLLRVADDLDATSESIRRRVASLGEYKKRVPGKNEPTS